LAYSNHLHKAFAQKFRNKDKNFEAEKAEYVQFGVMNLKSQRLSKKFEVVNL
jgi:hypothetical protein